MVSRLALERALWPDATVSSAALSRLVKEGRRILGDAQPGRRWIETRRGRGFRFAARTRERGSSPADLPYVGREPLVRRLDAVLDAAFRGRGHMLLLSGEPGVGKTRTAEELALRARLLGAQVATAWSSEAAGAPGYWSWIQLLRALGEGVDAAKLRARLGPSSELLSRLVPELRDGAVVEAQPVDGAVQRFQLFDGVRGFLARSARDAPLALVLDDLHWSDAESIELLDFLSHDLARIPLVLLATYREPELAREPRRARLVARLSTRPGVECWPLTAFSKDEARAFIEACTAREPAPGVVELLFGRSDGSPLFLSEILRAAARKGILEDAPEIWENLAPSGLERFIEARVRTLSAGARSTLSLAAAIGREFEDALLARVGGLAEDVLEAAIVEGETARVVVPAPGRPGRHRFTHALVRDALYAGLAADARAEVHASIAAALELDAGGAEVEPEVLAHHCFAAIPVLGAERAIEACVRAGERAFSLNAFDVAARHLTRALELIDADVSPGRRFALLLRLGEARRLLGDGAGARTAFARAADLAGAHGDAADVARATLGFAGLYAYGAPDPEIVARIEAAAEALAPEHEALRARLLGRLASELMLHPDRGRRAELRRRAWQAAGNGGDLAALVEIAAHPDHGIWDTMVPPEERLALAEKYALRCAERGLRVSELAAQVMVLDEFLRLGRMDDYDERAPRIDRLAAEIREPRLLWARRLQGCSRELVRGDLDAAQECAERARDFAQRHLDPLAALALWGRQLAVLRAEQGRLAELREPWERAGAGAGTSSNRALHAWICAADGDRARAREIAAPLLADDAAALEGEPMACANAAVLAEVCVFLDERAPVEALLGQLRPHAGMNALRTYAACHGPVDYFLGLLESLRGRTEAAERHQREALALVRRMGTRSFAPRSRKALGDLRGA